MSDKGDRRRAARIESAKKSSERFSARRSLEAEAFGYAADTQSRKTQKGEDSAFSMMSLYDQPRVKF